MGPDYTASVEAAIKLGRGYYSSLNFKRALEYFTRAMRLCSCNRGLKRERCSCKCFQRVLDNGGSIFKEAMYNCTCAVGRTFNKCDKAAHIQALDYRAATFEVMKKLDRARKDAEWMLELAPRLPDGYLRLGKIARLQKDDKFAWKVYCEGVEVARANHLADTSKGKQLYCARKPLQFRFSRLDPLLFPPEILHQILLYCDLVTRVRCLVVSRTWNRTLSKPVHAPLWRDLKFGGSHSLVKPPRIEGLRKLASKSGNDIRRIVIADAKSFQLTQPKLLALVAASKRLEHLEIVKMPPGLEIPQHLSLCKTLKTLILSHARMLEHDIVNSLQIGHMVRSYPHSFIHNVAEVVEHLDLEGLPFEWFQGRLIPLMPKLKTLRLCRIAPSDHDFPLLYMAEQTPELEQLSLQDVWTSRTAAFPCSLKTIWTKLKTIMVKSCSDRRHPSEYLLGVTLLTSISHGKNIELIDLDLHDYREEALNLVTDTPMETIDVWGAIDGTGNLVDVALNPDLVISEEPDPYPLQPWTNSYPNLRTLHLSQAALLPRKTRPILEPSVQRGILHTLDINFPPQQHQVPWNAGQQSPGISSLLHIAGYDWLRGATCIRSLSINGFRFRPYPRHDDDFPLPAFLASFPNLETLEIRSLEYDQAEFCIVLEAILKATKLKTLYQCQVKGTDLDLMVRIAKQHNVVLKWGRRPRLWPVPSMTK